MFRLIFTLLCFIISVYGTTVQLWTSANKLLADVSTPMTCYRMDATIASELHRYYVEYNCCYVYWYTDTACNDYSFTSESTGYINYYSQGDQPRSFYINDGSCDETECTLPDYTIG